MKSNPPEDFAVFILTNGRPDKVVTYKTTRAAGYTGPIYLIVDDLDKKKDRYIEVFGDQVIIFNKREIAEKFDQGDNFNDLRSIFYARNACFEIAKKLGLKHFIQFDDDYTDLRFRFDNNFKYIGFKGIKNLNRIFKILLEFYEVSGAHSIALSQGGDFIGGEESPLAKSLVLRRKCMNSFICSTERSFQFVGRLNEDVNTYTRMASTGLLFFTLNQLWLNQMQTQSNSGGMTELYLDSGTYVKSFYSVMYQPSSVTVRMLNTKFGRLHHSVNWNATVPKILPDSVKKK